MFCSQCGAQVDTTKPFCANCGRSLSGATSAAAAVSHLSPPYAGFWRRVGAWVLDYIALVIIMVVLAMPLSLAGKSQQAGVLVLFLYGLAPWLYFAISESSSMQGTLGKAAAGIKVTDLNGERLGFGRATGRYFGKILSGLTMSVGFAMAGFTEKRQALHDKVADTLVVTKEVTPAEIAAAPPAPQASGLAIVGLVVLVILCGPFGIGILAAIAIPAYQDYTVRAQVADGLNNAVEAKAVIADALMNQTDLSQLQDTESFTLRSKYVSAIDNHDGVLVITFGGQASNSIAGKSLELVPGVDAANQIVWRCGYGPGADGAQFVVSDQPGRYTTVERKHLPMACR
jgi:uncharacterized RDD family membrane protein YckC/Tfp pilus assembly major pilin PilA